MPNTKVLILDDDETLRRVLAAELRELGFEVAERGHARGVAELVASEQPDVVLLDLRMPGTDGHAALLEFVKADANLPVVVLTGHGSIEDAVRAMHAGAYDFLQKPTRTALLEQTLRRARAHRDLSLANERLQRAAGAGVPADSALLGTSAAMQSLRHRIERVAKSDGSVLILGENGSGKELVARAIHHQSPRAGRTFVVVNCGAIPDELVHSELFGHAKGAFTGADRPRVGLFEAAHEGTLFLDEIGDLPRDLQPALLRALQFGEVRPVGSDRTRTVDVRVLAATNRELHRLIRDGQFREDLYYRLSALELPVPPLRDRGDDIPALAEHFLRRANARLGRRLSLTPHAIARLQAHSWPGNVRELENAMLRLVTMVEAETITADDIEQFVLARARSSSGDLPTLNIATLEKLAIEAAMKRFDDDKKRAAEAVGISLKTLYNKLNAQRDDGESTEGQPGDKPGTEP